MERKDGRREKEEENRKDCNRNWIKKGKMEKSEMLEERKKRRWNEERE